MPTIYKQHLYNMTPYTLKYGPGLGKTLFPVLGDNRTLRMRQSGSRPDSPMRQIDTDRSSAECYSVLCPFLTKLSIIYHWNQYEMFYLQSSLDVAYHISMRIYKLFNLASLPKNDFTLVLYCSMSILNQ